MDANTKTQILQAILDTANDIDAYLASNVPLECYRGDIDHKLRALWVQIDKME